MSSNAERNAQDIMEDEDPFNDLLTSIHIPGDEEHHSSSSSFMPSPPPPSQQSRIPPRSEQEEEVNKVPQKYIRVMNLVDSRKELSVWRYLKFYDSDPLVQEYVKLIVEVKTRPGIVDNVELSDLEIPNYDLPIPSQTECLNNFFHYFQCRYFARNIKNATDNNICVANPLYKLTIPQFQSLPLGAHKEISEMKQSYGLAIQITSLLAIAFNIELYLLRIFNEILTTVKAKAETPVKRDPDFKYYFLTLYTAARVEFHKCYRVKEIDWAKRVTKARESLPKWRKESSQPPINVPNRYAQALIKKVTEGKQIINATEVLKDLKDFINHQPSTDPNQNLVDKVQQNDQPSSSSSLRKNITKQDNVKVLTKSRKGKTVAKCNENPAFLRNRNLSETENPTIIDPTKMIKRQLSYASNRRQSGREKFISIQKIFPFYSNLSKRQQSLLFNLYKNNMESNSHIHNLTKGLAVPPAVQLALQAI